MNQVQFSKKIGISQGFLSDLEKGSKIASKSLSLLLESLSSGQSFKLEQDSPSLNETDFSGGVSYNKTKIKHITLMEQHVNSLSEIIKLKEEISELKNRKKFTG
jgi:hypothetical protein